MTVLTPALAAQMLDAWDRRKADTRRPWDDYYPPLLDDAVGYAPEPPLFLRAQRAKWGSDSEWLR